MKNLKYHILWTVTLLILCSFSSYKKRASMIYYVPSNANIRSTNEHHDKNSSDSNIDNLASFLKNNWKTPEQYIIDKFKKRDIIFLAEEHRVKHNLLLVQDIIPLLYKSGVYNIGMEFGASEDQEQLDSLVTAPEYDEDIARKIMFNYNVGWAFKEYMDVYRAAWKLNKTLPDKAKKFRILNLSYKYNMASCNVDNVGDNPIVQERRIFHKGGTEWYRANIIRSQILDKNEKILILTGWGHAFTKYVMHIYDPLAPNFYRLDDRMLGNMIYKIAPRKVFTILLHSPFYSKTSYNKLVYPASGVIDSVMSHFNNKRVGFDLEKTPFGTLPETLSYYSIGYPNLRLKDLADGYIYQKPFNEYEGCTIDEKFLTPENWHEAQLQHPSRDLKNRPNSLEEYRKQIREYNNLKIQYKKLKY